MNTLARFLTTLTSAVFLLLSACVSNHSQQIAQYDLYLLIGQSNMAGRGTLEPAGTPPHERVVMLGKDGKWVSASDPLHFDKPKYVGVGPGLSFGKAMAANDKERIIGLVPAAVGGSEIALWMPRGYHGQTKSYPYDDAIARTRLAMKSGTLKGILWHQGESDAHAIKLPYYKGGLETLAANLRRDLSEPDVPFIVGGLGEYLAGKQPASSAITDILKDVPSYIPNSGYVSAKGLTHGGDGVHFDTESARELGRRYAEKLIQMQSRLR